MNTDRNRSLRLNLDKPLSPDSVWNFPTVWAILALPFLHHRFFFDAKMQKTSPWIWNAIFVAFVHAVAASTPLILYPLNQVPIATWILTWVCWELATLGITTGYHRLWSHRSFEASWGLRVLLAWMGTLGFQGSRAQMFKMFKKCESFILAFLGSIRWWVLRHRLHHRFTDSDQDPYNAKRGLWFSHMGWIFEKPKYSKMRLIDAQDLLQDPIVEFQHRYFLPLAIGNGIILPAVIAHFGWNDFWGGFLYGGYVARVLIWHVTFCINSLAHWMGEQHFSKEHTARGGFLLAIVTQGEGYHNFHHEFPSDYRNGVYWWHYDPTKWFIRALSCIGAARNLNQTPKDQIEKSKLLTLKLELDSEMSHYKWGLTDAELNSRRFTRKDLATLSFPEWLILDGYIIDCRQIVHQHPGGENMIRRWLHKDATRAFHGGLNNHTQSARSWMETMRIGVFVDEVKPSGECSSSEEERGTVTSSIAMRRIHATSDHDS